MTFLLDTNAWIAYLRRSHPGLISRLQREPPRALALCSVVLGELIYGAERSGASRLLSNQQLVDGLRAKFHSLPFDDSAAEYYGRVRAHLASLGTPIGHNDLMIAAIALTHDLTVVTHNTAEFSRVPGLKLEDWQTN